MARNYTKTQCPLYGTRYCRALNMKSCAKCPITAENAGDAAADIDSVDSLLPPEGIERFFTGDRCVLCKGKTKNPADCYALVNLGNPEPKRTGNTLLGIKTKLKAGSILPLQLSCCSQCRKRYSRVSDRRTVYTVLAAGTTIGLMCMRSVLEAVNSLGHFMAPLVFLLVTGTTWGICTVRRRKLIREYSKKTYLNIFQAEGMEELKKMGWFEIDPYKDMSRMIFSDRPLEQGLYTAFPEEREKI